MSRIYVQVTSQVDYPNTSGALIMAGEAAFPEVGITVPFATNSDGIATIPAISRQVFVRVYGKDNLTKSKAAVVPDKSDILIEIPFYGERADDTDHTTRHRVWALEFNLPSLSPENHWIEIVNQGSGLWKGLYDQRNLPFNIYCVALTSPDNVTRCVLVSDGFRVGVGIDSTRAFRGEGDIAPFPENEASHSLVDLYEPRIFNPGLWYRSDLLAMAEYKRRSNRKASALIADHSLSLWHAGQGNYLSVIASAYALADEVLSRMPTSSTESNTLWDTIRRLQEHLPDASILLAYKALCANEFDNAVEMLSSLVGQVPVFSDGLRLALSSARFLSRGKVRYKERLGNMIESLQPYAIAADWRSMFTCFYGDTPLTPELPRKWE